VGQSLRLAQRRWRPQRPRRDGQAAPASAARRPARRCQPRQRRALAGLAAEIAQQGSESAREQSEQIRGCAPSPKRASSSSTSPRTDPRREPRADRSRRCCRTIRHATSVDAQAADAIEPAFAAGLHAMLCGAARLQALAHTYSTDWPAKSRPILPGNAPATRQERTWAPILAWIVLRSLPAYCIPTATAQNS